MADIGGGRHAGASSVVRLVVPEAVVGVTIWTQPTFDTVPRTSAPAATTVEKAMHVLPAMGTRMPRTAISPVTGSHVTSVPVPGSGASAPEQRSWRWSAPAHGVVEPHAIRPAGSMMSS